MAVNGQKEDVDAIVKSIGDQYGTDLVVDTAGSSATLDMSIKIVRPGGQITKVGWGPGPVGFSLDSIIAKSVRLQGHFSHTWDVWEKCITLLSKKQIDLNVLITHDLPISKWDEAFFLVESKEAMKVVLYPDK